MSQETGTATDHDDLFDRLRAFLEETAGPGWDLLDYDAVAKSAIYQAPGLSSTEEIFFGFSLHEDLGLDTFALGLWQFLDYNPLLGHEDQPGISPKVYMPIWNDDMPYWFVANGQRLIITAKVSTVYPSIYTGKFLPHGTPSEYPQPLYLGGVVSTATTRWSTTSSNDRSFFDPGAAAYLCNPARAWIRVQNWTQSVGEASAGNSNYIAPYNDATLNSNPATRYRELRELVDGTYGLRDLVLVGENPSYDLWGTLEGAYAISGFNNAAENTLVIDGDDYVVFQDLNRTARHNYYALRLE